jgi:hypothetical protein
MSNELTIIEQETAKWELQQRKATAYSSSSLVPTQYRAQIEKKEYGKVVGYEPNPSAIANCIVAMNMANRAGADELMVMQNLYVIEGRPSWSSQWCIAGINNCGRYSPLKFKIEDLGEKEIDYFEYVYNKQEKKREAIAKKIKVHDFSCIAYATEKATGEILESSKVSIEMAVKEGWYTKSGSKWQTMPEVMLRYRSASFFSSIYAPEIKMGLMTVEEAQDVEPVVLSGKFTNVVDIPTTQTPVNFAAALEDTLSDTATTTIAEEPEFEINPDAAAQADKFNI